MLVEYNYLQHKMLRMPRFFEFEKSSTSSLTTIESYALGTVIWQVSKINYIQPRSEKIVIRAR